MRILHVINNLGSGGAEKLVFDLTKEIHQEQDITVLLLHKTPNTHYLKSLLAIGVKIIDLSNISNNRISLNKFIKLFKIIKYTKYDIINTHLFPSFYYIGILSIFLKNNYILTEHCSYNERRKYFFLYPVEKFIYSRFKRIVCVSNNVLNSLESYLPTLKNKMCVIENGINILNNIKIKKLNKNKTITLTMTARFSKDKDHITVIKALKNLNFDFKMIFLGEGETKCNIEKYVINSNLNKKVEFKGFINNINDILSNTDIFILSSHGEGLPLSIIEAMMHGIPVVASNVVGIRDVVGSNGLLFNKEDSIDLSEKINTLFYNEELYTNLSKNSILRSNDFSIITTKNKYINIYNNCL